MSSRVPSPITHLRRGQLLVAVFVVGGLAFSSAGGAFLIAEPTGGLPGVALGSEAILVGERIAVLFAGWLAALVVVSRALKGDLPVEVSGGGVRYADLETSQEELRDSRHAARDLDRQVETLVKALVTLERAQVEQSHLLRRYAVKGDDHGH